jgi:hypothetical protein
MITQASIDRATPGAIIIEIEHEGQSLPVICWTDEQANEVALSCEIVDVVTTHVLQDSPHA